MILMVPFGILHTKIIEVCGMLLLVSVLSDNWLSYMPPLYFSLNQFRGV